MLRINLLPIRQLKKRAKAKQQIAGFCVIFLCFLVILGAVYLFQVSTINSLNSSIATLNAEHKKLEPQIAALNKLKKDKAELERKISVINKLKAESSITVHILDEVAKSVDNSRMWLTALNQNGNSLSLTGVALDNQTIAQFMDMLNASPYIQTVNLSNSSLKNVSGKHLKQFALNCAISLPKEEQTKKKGK